MEVRRRDDETTNTAAAAACGTAAAANGGGSSCTSADGPSPRPRSPRSHSRRRGTAAAAAASKKIAQRLRTNSGVAVVDLETMRLLDFGGGDDDDDNDDDDVELGRCDDDFDNKDVSLLLLPERFRRSFETLREAWPQLRDEAPRIPPQQGRAGNAHLVTGFHRCDDTDDDNDDGTSSGNGWSSRYNRYREGWVRSNVGNGGGSYNNDDGGDATATLLFAERGDGILSESVVREALRELELALHDAARTVLEGIERDLELPPSPVNTDDGGRGWFQSEYGSIQLHSQWHLKQYCSAPLRGDENPQRQQQQQQQQQDDLPKQREQSATSSTPATDEVVLLPVHTDPSLLSIVVLDRIGAAVQPGGQGLQYYCDQYGTRPSRKDDEDGGGNNNGDVDDNNDNDDSSATGKEKKRGTWKEIPCSGYGVAVVFVGSLLAQMTGNYYRAAKHHVVLPREACPCVDDRSGGTDQSLMSPPSPRRAATLFVRPALDAVLRVPPSPLLPANIRFKYQNRTFEEWCTKVSKNYAKPSKNKNKKK